MREILSSLNRQHRAFSLLGQLLDEELSLLRSALPQEVASLQFSIQELIRQIGDEREFIMSRMDALNPGCTRIREMVSRMGDKAQTIVEEALGRLENQEQECARKAAFNADIAQALMDQSASLLSYLQGQLSPVVRNTYGSSGRWHELGAGSSLVSGRF